MCVAYSAEELRGRNTGTYRETDDIGEQGGDGGHDEDRAKTDRVRVTCVPLEIWRQRRDERGGVADLGYDLHVQVE